MAGPPFYRARKAFRPKSSGSLAKFTAILRAALPKSYRGAGFRVVPRALRHTPCVMSSLTGLLDCLTAKDNESNHDNDCK